MQNMIREQEISIMILYTVHVLESATNSRTYGHFSCDARTSHVNESGIKM